MYVLHKNHNKKLMNIHEQTVDIILYFILLFVKFVKFVKFHDKTLPSV